MSEQGFNSDDVTDELGSVEQQTSQLVAGALAMWVVRWVFGFAIIALVTWFKPAWSWLWWAGIVLASASLLFTLAMQFFLQRKVAKARKTAERLEAVLAELDEDEN